MPNPGPQPFILLIYLMSVPKKLVIVSNNAKNKCQDRKVFFNENTYTNLLYFNELILRVGDIILKWEKIFINNKNNT